jgi:hypothetical protein
LTSRSYLIEGDTTCCPRSTISPTRASQPTGIVVRVVAPHDRYYFIFRGTSPAEAGSKADQFTGLELGGGAVVGALLCMQQLYMQ